MSKELPEPISYEGGSEFARYSVAIAPENGPEPARVKAGMITVLPSGDNEQSLGDNSSAVGYYSGGELLSLTISHHDRDGLATYYKDERYQEDVPDFYTFSTFYAPFSEPREEFNEQGERTFMREGRLIYEKVEPSLHHTDESKVKRVTVPTALDTDITSMLHIEGELQQVADNDHNPEQDDSGITLFEADIPPKYRASFYTSVIRE